MDERKDPRPAAGDDAADAREPEASAPASGDAQLAGLRADAARYKEEAEHNWQQFLHAAADLENYKKQAVRQREDAVQRTRLALLGVVLAVADNLERALEHITSGDSGTVVEGIRMTHRQVVEQLAALGVTPMESKGHAFDPRYHEAVDVTAAHEHGVEPGTIVDEFQRGYLLNGEVLRPARVRVAK